MGLFAPNKQTVLTPQNPPLGIFPQFYAQQPTTLVLKEKVWSWSGVSLRNGTVSEGRGSSYQVV